MSVFLLFDEQCLGRAHFDGPLDIGPGVFGRLGVGDLDLAPLGYPEVVRGLQLAHRVALAQVQVGFDAKTHRRCLLTMCACGSALWRAGPAAPPSWSDRCDSCPRAAPFRIHTRAITPRRSP